MRFSVDAHAIGCHLTGNEVYIRNLLHEFARLDRSSDFIAYVSKPGADLEVPKRIRTSRVSTNPFRRLGWDLSMRLRHDKPDLLHVQYTSPLACSVPVVVSVHDVSYLEYPQYFTRFRAAQLRLTVKRTVEAAARVLTPSEFSRKAILKHYQLDARKVVVVPNAVSASFRPVDREVASRLVEEKFGIRSPFILTVGDLQPRKNHLGLLRAFEDLIRQHPQLPHRLVFVGKETWYSKELHKAVVRSGIAGRVDFTGFVEDQDLLQFYGACDLFVFPSFYEGFGLPILEAMACGRAVACSNATAMPEVANAAGILFDPYSVQEMARAMGDILLDGELRGRLERLGTQRAASFTWERAAQRTLDVYYEVAGVRKNSSGFIRPSIVVNMKPLVLLLCLLPASAESLHYSINWASGLSLGEATLSTAKGKEAWDFQVTLDASIPGFALRDEYHSAATIDLCSLELDKNFTNGSHKTEEKTTFDQQNHSATRETQNGGKSDMSVSSCAKDALTFLQFARSELAQGRLVPQQTIEFGAPYNVRIEYTGAQTIKVGEQMTNADRILATVKGPSADMTVEIFFAKDPARTPLMARIPLSLGSFTVELIR